MIVSKPAIIFYTGQAFCNFIAMSCFAGVASFQAKWGVGPCKWHIGTSFLVTGVLMIVCSVFIRICDFCIC